MPNSRTGTRVHKQTNLLSVVVGLKDVADGPAVAPATHRLQDETEQSLVVLMRRTLEHGG